MKDGDDDSARKYLTARIALDKRCAVAEAEAVDATQRLKRAEADVEALRAVRCDDLDYLRGAGCRRQVRGESVSPFPGRGRGLGCWRGSGRSRRSERCLGRRRCYTALRGGGGRARRRWLPFVLLCKMIGHRGRRRRRRRFVVRRVVQASDSAQGRASRRGVRAPELPSVQASVVRVDCAGGRRRPFRRRRHPLSFASTAVASWRTRSMPRCVSRRPARV